MKISDYSHLKPIGIDESKAIQLEILKYVVSVCEKYNIKYYLAFGTLLGAVRHGGFIPWDDDIDLIMPKPDYDKLIDVFNAQSDRGYFELIAPGSKRSKHSMIKVIDNRTVKVENRIVYNGEELGIDIDIFPLDGRPDSPIENSKWCKKLNRIYTKFLYSNLDFNCSFKMKLLTLYYKFPFKDSSYYIKKADELHSLFPFDECEYAGVYASCFSSEKRLEKSLFDKQTDLMFEGFSFKAPAEYDKILTSNYGDYMKLPPREEQITHHLANTFWKENI